ncbi:MAG: glycosyltransferase [Eggerthellaceae bacterium]|nr:glycosyltransferase [Eggerthellaceae bacterium]
MPRVSVVVPLYNTEAFVASCLQSLQNQLFDDFEVICVNDGSSDASLEVAQSAVQDDARFIFVNRENGGLSAARNTGLEYVHGEYVSFLDSDDCYAPETLEMLYEKASAEALDVLDFSAVTFYESDKAREQHQEDYSYRKDVEGVLSGPEIFKRYWDDYVYVASACFHFIRRAFLEEHGLRFKEGILHEDELFTPLLYAHANRCAFLNRPLYLRRMRTGSIMTQPRGVKNMDSIYKIVSDLQAWADEHTQEYNEGFMGAFRRNIDVLQETMARTAASLDPQDLDNFLSTLSVEDRTDFLARAGL